MQDILVNRLIASGFWQIQMHPNSREKTAFITPHGLYESRLHAGDRCIYPGARCQVQPDNQLHIQLHMQTEHYTSEKRYGITESETLTGCSLGYIPLSSLLHWNKVTVLTDHTVVKAVLEAANPSAKHARWWTKVYGRGVRSVNIKYRAGREKENTDAL